MCVCVTGWSAFGMWYEIPDVNVELGLSLVLVVVVVCGRELCQRRRETVELKGYISDEKKRRS